MASVRMTDSAYTIGTASGVQPTIPLKTNLTPSAPFHRTRTAFALPRRDDNGAERSPRRELESNAVESLGATVSSRFKTSRTANRMKFSRLISPTSMSDRCASALSKCIAAWMPANPPPMITILPLISQSLISLSQKSLPYLSTCLLRPYSARLFH
jgi:hypothetical protein